MTRTASSTRWLHEHVNDQYVKKANNEGWRSRAIYKLKEIDEKYHLLLAKMLVVELGASPGGWTQYAAQKVGNGGKIIAVDLLSMVGMANVEVIIGDFTETATEQAIINKIDGKKIKLVLSDMSPNLSGIKNLDQTRSILLAELALDFACNHLDKNGNFLVKVFQGAEFNSYRQNMQKLFTKVICCKPDASRDRSSEVYLLGLNFKAENQSISTT